MSTIDVGTRTKNPTDIAVGSQPSGVAITPNGRTAFVANALLVAVQNNAQNDARTTRQRVHIGTSALLLLDTERRLCARSSIATVRSGASFGAPSSRM
jgi:DNA-binding beta-propeller fold protein YncE